MSNYFVENISLKIIYMILEKIIIYFMVPQRQSRPLCLSIYTRPEEDEVASEIVALGKVGGSERR